MEPKKHYSYLFLDSNNHPDRPEFELDFNDSKNVFSCD